MDSNEQCSRCGIERPWIHKHHVVPRSQGGSNDPSNLLRLCANCHEDLHERPCGNELAQTPELQEKMRRNSGEGA